MDFDYRKKLKEELEARQSRNRFYSLRAFSRDLGISVTALHSAIHCRRHLSKRNMQKVCDSLGWTFSPEQPTTRLQLITHTPEQQEKFERQWYHDAILNLARRGECFADANWLSARLGLEKELILKALNLLAAFELIQIEGQRILASRKEHTLSKAVHY